MNSRDVVCRLEAYKAGRPLARGSTIHLHMGAVNDALLLAFVRMGGESRPWGIAFGRRGKKRTVLTVPEPRDRTLLADMVLEFAPILLAHLLHPDFVDEEFGKDSLPPLRQLWTPNATHVAMLHHMAYAFSFTRFGDYKRQRMLQAFGRAVGWLFRESQRPGQMMVIDCTAALRASFAFPADDLRQQHLGFLLAWLRTKGSRGARIRAAAAAERQSVATSLEPKLEREILEPLVHSWNGAREAQNVASASKQEKTIHDVLAGELLRRLELVDACMACIENDKRLESAGTDTLAAASRQEFWYQYLRLEHHLDDEDDGPAHPPSPETDRNASLAAWRYFVNEAADQHFRSAFLHDDADVLEEWLASGDAFQGRILRVTDEGNARGRIPVWTIRTSSRSPLRLREGSAVMQVGLPTRRGIIRAIQNEDSARIIVLEITALKTARKTPTAKVRAATSSDLKGVDVAFARAVDPYFPRLRGRRVWRNDGAGCWLTHDAGDDVSEDSEESADDDFVA